MVASICAFITESLLQKHCHIFSKANPRLKRDSRTKRDGESMSFIKELSSYAIPALIFVILSAGIYKGVKCMTFFWRGKGRDNHCFKDYTRWWAYGCSRGV